MSEQKRTREVIPSAYNIISSNRSIGYSLDAAIADIIDNSISAEATKIDLLSFGKNPSLFIVDNGKGMDSDELADAMTFGGKINCQAMRDLKDLGRFGMGLKTASLSQCKRLEVVSKKNGSLTGGCWDLEYLKKNDSWEFIVLNEDECLEKVKETFLSSDDVVSGTVVIWTNFDRLTRSAGDEQTIVFDSLMYKSIKKLELIFHRYLEGEDGLNKVTIRYNNESLKPNNPFLPSKAPSISNEIIAIVNKSKVSILCHKLPHPEKLTKDELDRLTLESTLLETQGFYVYRNKRLIDYATWFGMASKLEKTKLSRIQIDIPNDQDSEWSLDIKKAHVIPPQTIRGQLRNILKTNQGRSEKTFKPHQLKNGESEATPYWNREIVLGKKDVIKYSINLEHPLISSFMADLPDKQLADRFKVILNSTAKFFPFGQVEYDNQQDKKIENAKREIDEQIKINIEFYKKLGITNDEIVSYYPGMEKAIREYLEEGNL